MQKRKSFVLDGQQLHLEDLPTIAHGASVTIGRSIKKKVDASRKLVKDLIEDSTKPYYGINTGFGYFANTPISEKQLLQLQRNIIVSHAGGWGDLLSLEETRLAMSLRLNVLIQGHTGVRYEVCETLARLLQEQIYPLIPKYGSVGASGDLVPLAHLALPLIGEGKVSYKNKIMPAAKALKAAGIQPLQLVEKEGLGLVNGTQIMLAVGSWALVKAFKLRELADTIAALTYEGLNASPFRSMRSSIKSGARKDRSRPQNSCAMLSKDPISTTPPPNNGACKTPTRCGAPRKSMVPRAMPSITCG